MGELNPEISPSEALTSSIQNLAERFKSGEITEEEKGTLQKLADEYISYNSTGDHGYYAEDPSPGTSYNEFAFYDLPNGLHLEGGAGNHSNNFTFHDVLTTEEMEKRIAYLKSTAKE